MTPSHSEVRFCIDTIMASRTQRMLRWCIVMLMVFLFAGWGWVKRDSMNVVQGWLFGGLFTLCALSMTIVIAVFVWRSFVELRFMRVRQELSTMGERLLQRPQAWHRAVWHSDHGRAFPPTNPSAEFLSEHAFVDYLNTHRQTLTTMFESVSMDDHASMPHEEVWRMRITLGRALCRAYCLKQGVHPKKLRQRIKGDWS